MRKNLMVISIALLIALLTGCVPAASTPTVTSVAATQTPAFIVVTATPDQNQVPAATLEPTVAATATPAPANSINITSVTADGKGQVQVNWEATGEFPAGFEVAYSSTNQTPAIDTDSVARVDDPTARSAVFKGNLNTLYYVRVCRYLNSACTLYSNVGIVAVFPPTAQPTKPVVYATSSTPRSTAVPPTPKITIYLEKPAGAGAVALYWTATGSTFDNGFLILYGTDPSQLVYGEGRAVAVPDGKYRVFTMTGGFKETYYFKICRFTGTNCDYPSNVVAFTFTSPN